MLRRWKFGVWQYGTNCQQFYHVFCHKCYGFARGTCWRDHCCHFALGRALRPNNRLFFRPHKKQIFWQATSSYADCLFSSCHLQHSSLDLPNRKRLYLGDCLAYGIFTFAGNLQHLFRHAILCALHRHCT